MPVTAPSRRRRRRLRRNKKPGLPTDILLHHIAPRLPAKSVFRLMAVCKEFHSFLKSRQFTKMHLHHVTNNHRHKFLVLSNDTGRWLFGSIDCETPTTPDDCLIYPPPSRRVPFLTGFPPYMRILSSFHGLLCVGINQHSSAGEYSDLILWNPATDDYKILSKTNVVIDCSWCVFGLYYSCCDDDYKILNVNIRREVYMYSLRFDSWRKLVVVGRLEYNFLNSSNEIVWLNENLYFFSGWLNSTITRFDTITEKITVMKLPSYFEQPDFPVEDVCKSLFVHKGYINLCVRFEGIYGNVKYDTWRMNEDNGDWSMVDTYDMYKLREPLACRLKRRSHLIRNGEWLVIHRPLINKNHILYMLDPEKKAYTYTYTGLNYSNIISEEGRYTETLVSPNQYN